MIENAEFAETSKFILKVSLHIEKKNTPWVFYFFDFQMKYTNQNLVGL